MRIDDETERKGRRVPLLVTKTWLQAVDEWRRAQPDVPNRSEAIRRLVEQALAE